MPDHAHWMERCLQLARLGASSAAPNPMVGCVLVQGDRLLAEGWHHRAGEPHAEVNCLRAFGNGPVPSDAVLYVNLEPCNHHGRTPPCTELIIERGVKHMVIAHADPFPAVSGKGIERLRSAGVAVTVGIEEAHARWTNRRFLASIEQGRPYIVLKWAQSADGFLDKHPRGDGGVQRISDPATDVLVHQWRSEEQAILVGSRTVVNDDPRLDVRHVEGRSPLRVVMDRECKTPAGSHVFDDTKPTLLFTSRVRPGLLVEQYVLGLIDDPIDHVLTELHRRSVRSLLVEGGAELLGHFIERGLWDEARVISAPVQFLSGTPAPIIGKAPVRSLASGPDAIDFHAHHQDPADEWYW